MKKNISIILLLMSSFVSYSQTTITVDSTVTYQTIDGWEATCNPLVYPGVRDTILPHMDSLINLAVNDVGITRLRHGLNSGIENGTDYFTQVMDGEITYDEFKQYRYCKINDNSDPFNINPAGFNFSRFQDNLDNLVIPFKEVVEGAGEKFYFNLCFVDFKNQSSFHHTSNPEEYAEFMTAAWLFMDSLYHFTPDGLELILEPDNADIWGRSQIPTSLEAVGNRLSSLGYDPEYIAPSLKSIYGIPNYINDIAKNQVAMDYLDVISFHRYSGNSDTTAQKKIVELANLYGKKTAMLEYDKNGDVNELHYDLKHNNVTAWTKYALMYKSDEKFAYVYVNASDSSNPRYGICKQTKYLRQYFKFIRPGAVRTEALTSNPSIDPVSFVNKSGNRVVVIKAEKADSINIKGLTADEYAIKYTLGNYDWGAVAPKEFDINLSNRTISEGDTLSFYMPEKGVVTVYGIKGENPCSDTYSTITTNACNYYESPSGKYTWHKSGFYSDTLINAAGCDSIISFELTVHTVNTAVTHTPPVIRAAAADASFRWLNCDEDYSYIEGENQRTFKPSENGLYAVEVTQNNCKDTSDCVLVNYTDVIENTFDTPIVIFPNPSDGNININLGKTYPVIQVIVKNELGQKIMDFAVTGKSELQFYLPGEDGVRFIEISSYEKKALFKLMRIR